MKWMIIIKICYRKGYNYDDLCINTFYSVMEFQLLFYENWFFCGWGFDFLLEEIGFGNWVIFSVFPKRAGRYKKINVRVLYVVRHPNRVRNTWIKRWVKHHSRRSFPPTPKSRLRIVLKFDWKLTAIGERERPQGADGLKWRTTRAMSNTLRKTRKRLFRFTRATCKKVRLICPEGKRRVSRAFIRPEIAS